VEKLVVFEEPELASQNGDVTPSVVSGFGWTGIALVGKQLFQFITLAILAHLLTPTDFGLIALVLVITDFVYIFNGELGFAEAIIQHKNLTAEHLHSVFWLNILFGCLIGGGIFAAAPIISNFYDEPDLVLIARLLSINFPIYALRTVPLSLLRRHMQFKQLGIIELSAMITGGIAAVFLAYMGFGVWSLVFQALITMLVMVSALWFVTKWRPRFIISLSAISELWAFSRNMIGFYAWEYWTKRGDNLLIGKILGPTLLGYYTRAYTTVLIPNQIALVFRRVMLPALSKLQDDTAEMKRLYLDMLSYVALAVTPILFGLAAMAENFVVLVYGPKWLPMIGAMRWLCVVGFFLTIGSTVDSIFQARNRTDLLFKWGIVSGLAAFASFGLGIWFGSIESVAITYAFTLAFLAYWNFTIPGRLIGLTFMDVVRTVDGYLICAVGMAIIVYLFDIRYSDLSILSRFFIQLCVGLLSYTALLAFVEKQRFRQICKLLWQIYRRKFSHNNQENTPSKIN